MTIQAVLALIVAMIIFVASPGPGVFAVIARALSQGFKSSLSFIAGVILGDLSYLIFAILGLSAIATAFGQFFVYIKIAGGLYLIWLGFNSWRNAGKSSDDKSGFSEKKHGLAAGLLLTLGNPKVILFYLGFLPTFVDLANLNWQSGLSVVFIIATVILFVLGTYAYFASKLRGLFQNERARANLERVSGGFLMSVGILVILKK